LDVQHCFTISSIRRTIFFVIIIIINKRLVQCTRSPSLEGRG